MKSKLILILTGVMLLYATGALATGINVLIDNNGIKDKSGGALSAGNYHPYKDNLEFFRDSLPSPLVGGRLTVDTGTQFSQIGSAFKYQFPVYDGGTLYVRVWNGTPRTQGSYYGKTSHAIASGTTLPYDFPITDLKTVYKADKPYAPTIGSINESIQRTGNSQALQLVVPVSYNDTGSDGTVIEAQNFSILVKYPDGKTETKTGDKVTLNNIPSGDYVFTPTAINWFGATSGTPVPYSTLGGGGALPVFTYYFYPPAATGNVVPTTMCINSLALTKPSATAITKASDLCTVINTANSKKIVSAICKGNAADGTLSTAIFDANGSIVDRATDFDLKAGEPVQVYVTATGSVEIQ